MRDQPKRLPDSKRVDCQGLVHIARTSLLQKFTSCDSFDLLSYMQSADLFLYIISDYSFGNSLESNSYSEKGPRDLCFLIKPDELPWRFSGKKIHLPIQEIQV